MPLKDLSTFTRKTLTVQKQENALLVPQLALLKKGKGVEVQLSLVSQAHMQHHDVTEEQDFTLL